MARRLVALLVLVTIVSSQDPCKICKDGAPLGLPDKLIDLVPNTPTLPCNELDSIASIAFQTNTVNCNSVQSLGTLCGCARDEGACTLCGDGSDVIDEFKREEVDLPSFTAIFGDIEGFAPTCELIEGYLHSLSSRSEFCSYSQHTAAILCGCPTRSINGTNTTTYEPGNGLFSPPDDAPTLEAENLALGFYGNKNSSQLQIQQRITRSAAILSILAALIVMIDNLRNQKRRTNLYNQIVTLMAMFDIITSIAYSLLDVPRPADDAVVNPFEMGNAATCTAQGWFIQWGQSTSLALNAALSTYYLVSIVYCYTETKINKIRKYVLCVPLLAGLILALAAIPFISYGGSGCFVLHPGIADALVILGIIDRAVGWGPLLGLVIIPIYVVLLYTTATMIRVYWYVRKTDRKSNKWKFRSQATDVAPSIRERYSNLWRSTFRSSTNKKPKTARSSTSMLRREVAWQSLWYLFALYITWGLYATVNLTQEHYAQSHWNFWNVYFFLLPLQGFMNAVVYFRPRFSRRFSSFSEDLRKRREAQNVIIDGQEEDALDTAEKQSAIQRIKLRISSFRLCGQESNFTNVEPAVDLLAVNRESRVTVNSVVDQQTNSNHDDVENPQDRNEDALVGDDNYLEDATSMLGESERVNNPDDDMIAANQVIEAYESGETKEEEKETSEMHEVATNEEIASVESDVEKVANRTKKETLELRRRRSSLKMLVGTLMGVDGTPWWRKSNGSGSASEENASEIHEIVANEEIASTESDMDKVATRRRRSSLKMLVGTLMGVDGTPWWRKSNGSESASEENASEIHEIVANEEIASTESDVEAKRIKKETLKSRRRRSSLKKMLVGTLIGVDGKAWLRKSDGSGSASSGNS